MTSSQSFDADRSTPRGLLQTADRALLILLGTDREHEGWSVTEVSHEFGFSISVAHRLLATLAHRGFLLSDPETKRYRIGPAAMTVGRIWTESRSMRHLVDPILSDLAEETGLVAIFALPDTFHMRAVAAQTGAGGPLREYPLIGELFPAHAGATSKAYYAHLPAAARRRLLHERPRARFTEATITEPDQLETEFAKVRRQGYAWTTGEYDAGVSTVAVLVRLRGEPFGSLSLGAPEEAFQDVPDLVDRLRLSRARIEAALSGART